MKKFITALAALSAIVAAPAMAQDFIGPRAELRVGSDHVNVNTKSGTVSANGVTYGGAVGYDVPLGHNFIAGVDLGLDASSADHHGAFTVDAKHDFEAGGRLGYILTQNLMVYGRAAYSNERIGFNYRSTSQSGFRYGGGAEFALNKHAYLKAEYRTTDYDHNLSDHQIVGGAGYRFGR